MPKHGDTDRTSFDGALPGGASDEAKEWNPGKSPFMTPEELAAFEKTTAALRDRSAALADESKRLSAETEEMKNRRLEMEARSERMVQRGAKVKYQQEINSVAINVLVSILTKDALKGIRDSEYTSSPRIDISETVDFALMVAKRYIDELQKIGVSQRQIDEYKDHFQATMDLQQQGMPMGSPPVEV